MLGGTSALVSSMSSVSTQMKAIAISAKKIGNTPRQPILPSTATPASAPPPTRNEETVLPIPLNPCAKLRLRP